MDYIKELAMLESAEKRSQEITDAAKRLRFSLAALTEMESGAKVKLSLDCGNGAELNIAHLLPDGENVEEFIKNALEETARKQYEILRGLYEPAEAPKRGRPKTETPEKIKTELVMELPERIPVAKPSKVVKLPGVVNDKILSDLYYKRGLGVQAISEKTGLPEEVVFSQLEKIKSARLKAEKERARRQ